LEHWAEQEVDAPRTALYGTFAGEQPIHFHDKYGRLFYGSLRRHRVAEVARYDGNQSVGARAPALLSVPTALHLVVP